MTVYVPKAAAKRLKQMALDHDRRINDFLQEGVDLMLAKYGQPSLADFEKK
ncbi:ribbon-helix-helix domain-containing protein [Lichenibacterium minor]|uniref:ribbon-helix-helix domain-containing protein n=1 Tax=Lichenibacterium minor TaxID=2316528 RepID=UPI00315D2E30